MQDIITLKEQGLADQKLIDLLKLKGEKEENIITTLNDFYTQKNATQVAEDKSPEFPLLQLIILVLLIIIAGVLGVVILQR